MAFGQSVPLHGSRGKRSWQEEGLDHPMNVALLSPSPTDLAIPGPSKDPTEPTHVSDDQGIGAALLQKKPDTRNRWEGKCP